MEGYIMTENKMNYNELYNVLPVEKHNVLRGIIKIFEKMDKEDIVAVLQNEIKKRQSCDNFCDK